MAISEQVRKQLIASFRAELAEHVQTITDGLLALEQNRLDNEQKTETLRSIFRAAHSLKGAARAVGVNTVAQMAHALEDVLDRLNRQTLELTPALCTACYAVLDAIQDVEKAYEAGATTPPPQANQAMAALESFRSARRPEPEPTPIAPAVVATGGELPQPTASVTMPETRADSQPEPGVVAATSTEPETAESATTVEAAMAPRPERANVETIRIDAAKLDALMAQVSELHISRIRAEQRLTQVQRAQEVIGEWQKEWLAVRETYGRLNRHTFRHGTTEDHTNRDLTRLLTYLATSQERLRHTVALINEMEREYANDTMQLSLAIDALEDEIKRARMLPLSTITASFGRMVRDLAQAAGKEVTLNIIGGDVELDKRVLELIKDPLIHLLRNAIDHGVETPRKRISLGKSPVGTLTLKAEHHEKNVIISISDDGRGLDFEAIRHVLARRMGAEAQTLSEAELTEAIFSPGVSTSPIVTDVSGRGIGLDVVRRNVEELHGRIQVVSNDGAGTTFILTLPLAVSSSRALVVQVSDQTFAIPLNAIERILDVTPQEIYRVGGREMLRYNGTAFTVTYLSDVLNLPRVTPTNLAEQHLTVLLLASAQRQMAFIVDRLRGEQEVVIKELGRQVQRLGGIAGATITGDGTVLLVLNTADLIKLALRNEGRTVTVVPVVQAEAQTLPRQKCIFIVDDSITTRTLERNILEAAGYAIRVATDGLEALNAIEAESTLPDLVISDVAMPRMDGIELTKQLKNTPRTAQIPVILVTSLASTADKARGIEAGADAYIVKSNFDQNNLLETIEQLI
ncbi:MAG TPA: hybrid sensor histidine kinase/response regulator [Anaerolineae bacterium]|nr:hybrid sensor histidine kinase/response regulator [Anaerolineae bacterium]HQK12833.1 hybrid sensor histidine kinase/response regulator [Anaerolineae bacterium]